MRYDACIIGAGAEGLTSAASLARAGCRVIVLERGAAAGGRCVTREFAPGFFASPYVDELPAIPPSIFRDLDLARRGAILLAPTRAADRLDGVREAIVARVLGDAARPRRWLSWTHAPSPWPGEDLVAREDDSARLAGVPGGLPRGGLGALGAALHAAAVEAGAEIAFGAEVTDIRRRHGRVAAVGLADGREIATRAVISTLDLKRTFLALFAWSELPKPLVERIGAFRGAPGIARLLLALDSPPALPQSHDWDALRRPIVLDVPWQEATRAWASGMIPPRPPVVLRLVSAVDPFLAPDGAAVLTVTLHAVPHTPFDGPWTDDKRAALKASALARVDEALPETLARITAAELILPQDIEAELGATDGDLSGGALLPSQMLAFRPFAERAGTRTPIKGLYLSGPSSTLGPLATCASGLAAARAVMTDLGRLG